MRSSTSWSCNLALWCAAVAVSTPALAEEVEVRSVRLAVLKGQEEERFLAAHNAARKEVGVAPLAWSDELGQSAEQSLSEQKDRLVRALREGWGERRLELPEHRQQTEFGENIAAWMGTSRKGPDWGVTLWLREKAEFDRLNADGEYRVGDELAEDQPAASLNGPSLWVITRKWFGAARRTSEPPGWMSNWLATMAKSGITPRSLPATGHRGIAAERNRFEPARPAVRR